MTPDIREILKSLQGESDEMTLQSDNEKLDQAIQKIRELMLSEIEAEKIISEVTFVTYGFEEDRNSHLKNIMGEPVRKIAHAIREAMLKKLEA